MVSSLILKPSKLSEVFKLAPRLREDDKEELEASGLSPIRSLLCGFLLGKECISVYTKENLLIGMYGYRLVKNNIAIIWFLGSNEIENYPLTFVREGRKFINKLLKKGYTVANCVYSKNSTHINYIDSLGCTINFDTPVFLNGNKFYTFIRRE